MQTRNKLKNLRWEEAEWVRVGEIAKSVGLTRSAFIRLSYERGDAFAFRIMWCAKHST